MTESQRVRCANCGMTYDRWMPNPGKYGDPSIMRLSGQGVCPRCKSNAADPIEVGTKVDYR